MAQEVFPTKHALEKMQGRDVTWGEIIDVVNNPEVVYGPDFRGAKNYQKGDLCVIVARDGAIVTVLLKSQNEWNDTHAKSRKKK